MDNNKYHSRYLPDPGPNDCITKETEREEVVELSPKRVLFLLFALFNLVGMAGVIYGATLKECAMAAALIVGATAAILFWPSDPLP